MRIRLTLSRIGRQNVLPISYNYFLTGLIYNVIQESSDDYARFLHDEGYKPEDRKTGFKLFTYSMIKADRFNIRGDKIAFTGDKLFWCISSPVDTFMQHLVTGIFAKGQEIAVGPEGSRIKLLIDHVETLSKPEFSGNMKFTCMSPVTVSKAVGVKNGLNSLNGSIGLNGLNSSNRLKCHYLRPWEDGYSEAVKKNLQIKYQLIYGKSMDDPDFKVRVDTNYMNKKSGKITKNINFKGTNIIGFMAPFEVSGSPELIEVGYEAGFGEKGSMGFGMVGTTV